jgi:hypothetical protein
MELCEPLGAVVHSVPLDPWIGGRILLGVEMYRSIKGAP